MYKTNVNASSNYLPPVKCYSARICRSWLVHNCHTGDGTAGT